MKCTVARAPHPSVWLIAMAFSIVLALTSCQRETAATASAGGGTSALSAADRAALVRQVHQTAAGRIVDILQGQYIYRAQQESAIERATGILRERAATSGDEVSYERVVREAIAILPSKAVSWETRSERVAEESQDPSVYEGIGAYIAFRASPEPRVILLEVMPGSPAEAAGLRNHDVILSIDGTPVRPDEGQTVAARIRGRAGSTVSLLVRSPGGQPREVRVIRGQVNLSQGSTTLHYFTLEGTRIGYLAFPRAADENLAAEVSKALTEMAPGRLAGLVLDLRIATADGSWPIADLAGLFTSGSLGSFTTVNERQALSVKANDISGSQKVPLALLVGPDTEGLSEILAVGLQAAHRAIIVGQKTTGQIEGHQLFALPDGSRLAVATASFVTTTGVDVGLQGTTPDKAIATDWDAVTVARDPVRDAAVTALLKAAEGARR